MWIVFDFAAVPKELRYHINCIRQRCQTWSGRKVIIDEDCLPLVTVTIESDPPGSDIGLVGFFPDQYRYIVYRA
jgi:hypothetical protein